LHATDGAPANDLADDDSQASSDADALLGDGTPEHDANSDPSQTMEFGPPATQDDPDMAVSGHSDAADDAANNEAPEDAESNDSSTADPEEIREPSDLVQLPGAGEGLVWMLERAGISSLAELAEADADTLALQLGTVGELLDLTYWIEFAQESAGRDVAAG
jgi:predicted flap endonuclease-1-like 5' DNA nuclease